MSKLYVFGIGGTGSRVLRSLTMLLASGVGCGADTIVPIIVDPDQTLNDLTRSVEVMQHYRSVREKLEFTGKCKNKFFKTEIKEMVQGFKMNLGNTQDVDFKTYMQLSSMSQHNQALISMLFSQKNLDSNMIVGFKGNPNIGSVVLNQFEQSKDFHAIANTFQDGDRIFIISSIFGGTGASGFPLLAKTLRSVKDLPNHALISKAPIGAITVLPYFQLKQNKESEVDSGTFISKTKSALSYYQKNISDNNTLDALYYIADTLTAQYENNEGGAFQRNDAHFVEFASALSIIDFANSNNDQKWENRKCVHKEFGIVSADKSKSEIGEVTFENLGRVTQEKINAPMIEFYLFHRYMSEHCGKQYKRQPWAKRVRCDESFLNTNFVKDLSWILDDYKVWLVEMDNNIRRFSPFELKNKNLSLFSTVKGVPTSRNRFAHILFTNYASLDDRLNAQKKITASHEHQFVEMFYGALSQVVKEKYNI